MAFLGGAFIKGYSLRIGGATAYANSPYVGALTAGFMGLWTPRSRWDYMHAYEKPLQKSGISIGLEVGFRLADRATVVGAYASGKAPTQEEHGTAKMCAKIGF